MTGRVCLGRVRPGQTLAEFAIISLVLIVILVGIVDLSRAVYAYNMVKNAAREGARYAIIHPSDATGIEQSAKGLAIGLDRNLLSVRRDLVECSGGRCSSVKVTVEYVFLPVVSLVSLSMDGGTGNGLRLTGTSTMRFELPVAQ
ncbi:MAG: TadE/TadG family type IV pilus assembly protein [Anaerolineae bacterium]